MKRQKKQLLLMLAALVLLAAGYFLFRYYNERQANKEPEQEGEPLVSLEQEDIIRIAYDYEGTRYEYEKDGDTWYYVPDRELTLSPYRLNHLAEVLAGLTAESVISGVTDMGQYGLAEPARTFSFETAQEKYEFYVGDNNRMMTIYYICRPDSDTVYAVYSADINLMNLDVNEIVEEEEETE